LGKNYTFDLSFLYQLHLAAISVILQCLSDLFLHNVCGGGEVTINQASQLEELN